MLKLVPGINGTVTGLIFYALWVDGILPARKPHHGLHGYVGFAQAVLEALLTNISHFVRETVIASRVLHSFRVNKASGAFLTMASKTIARRSKSASPIYRPWNNTTSRKHLPPPESRYILLRAVPAFHSLRPYRRIVTALLAVLAVCAVVGLPYYISRTWVVPMTQHTLSIAITVVLVGLWKDVRTGVGAHAGRRRSTGMTAAAERGAPGRGRRQEGSGAGGRTSNYTHSGSQTDGPWRSIFRASDVRYAGKQ